MSIMICERGAFAVKANNGLHICHAINFDVTSKTEANAHLIAAAPELFSAAVALLKMHEGYHNDPLHAQAREILRKARGEARTAPYTTDAIRQNRGRHGNVT